MKQVLPDFVSRRQRPTPPMTRCENPTAPRLMGPLAWIRVRDNILGDKPEEIGRFTFVLRLP